MPVKSDIHLSKRERQIMDAVYARGAASVAQVRQAMPYPPGYSSVRALMRILEAKGHLRHDVQGNRYVYRPRRSRRDAARSAARRLLRTFFDGSAERAVAALLDAADTPPGREELDRLARLIDDARKEMEESRKLREKGSKKPADHAKFDRKPGAEKLTEEQRKELWIKEVYGDVYVREAMAVLGDILSIKPDISMN